MCIYIVVVWKHCRVPLEDAEIEQFGLIDHEITWMQSQWGFYLLFALLEILI